MIDHTESTAIAAGFLQYLEKTGKRDLLPNILAVLQKEVEPQLPEIVVESPIALSDADRQTIIQLLSAKPHSGDIQFTINPELIGGLKITHGDKVLDMSVQSKLRRIYA